MDESSINCGMTRLYGRARKRERVKGYIPDVRFERTSIISSIKINGKQAPFMFKGTLNKGVFVVYISEVLAPTLNIGDAVIIDIAFPLDIVIIRKRTNINTSYIIIIQ